MRALHDAGIEVILDVVYNHTAEGHQLGPTLSFRGIDNRTYYRLKAEAPRYYVHWTGCGNTLNVHHPRVRGLVLVSMPPQVPVSKLVQQVKGKSSYKLQREFRTLHKEYWGHRMWARGYFGCTTGHVSDEMIKAYVEGHTEAEDEFRVSGPHGFEPH